MVWCRGTVADQWRQAEGVWIPKEENSAKLEQFRTISLLSIEGKIFYSILFRRLTDFLLKNAYIDVSVQKDGIPGVLACIEHTGLITQLIRELREGKGDLVVVWLDLAHAYGSIPHKIGDCTGPTLCPQEDQGPHPELLQELSAQCHFCECNIRLASARKGEL